MSASLTREWYCEQCGNNFTMWYESRWSHHVIGCRGCSVMDLVITDRDLSLLPDDHVLVKAYYWMIEKGREETIREVVRHG